MEMKKVSNAINSVVKALYDLNECVIDSNIINKKPYDMDSDKVYDFMKNLSDDCYDAGWTADGDYWWSVQDYYYEHHQATFPFEEYEIEIDYGKSYKDLFIKCIITVKVFYDADVRDFAGITDMEITTKIK